MSFGKPPQKYMIAGCHSPAVILVYTRPSAKVYAFQQRQHWRLRGRGLTTRNPKVQAVSPARLPDERLTKTVVGTSFRVRGSMSRKTEPQVRILMFH